jgi:hypothetical protein
MEASPRYVPKSRPLMPLQMRLNVPNGRLAGNRFAAICNSPALFGQTHAHCFGFILRPCKMKSNVATTGSSREKAVKHIRLR